MKNVKLMLLFGIGAMLITMASCKKDEPQPTEPSTGATPTPRSFVTDVQPIINEYCITCHSGAQPSAGRDFSTYQSVKDAAQNANLVGRINNANNPMPTQGLMTQTNRTIIEDWTLTGYGQ